MSTPESSATAPTGSEFSQQEVYRALGQAVPEATDGRPRPEIIPHPRYRHEWQVVTEAMRRDIAQNANIRRELISFNTMSLSEELPATALHTLAQVDERVAALAHHYEDDLVPYLEQPPIPDKVIGRDLRTGLLPPETIYLVAERYNFGRDLKLLGLTAELEEVGGLKLDDHGEMRLPSGVHLQTDPEQPITAGPLLDPHDWEGREQIKDRVHKVTVAGQPYVMKERKTSRHTDTMRNKENTSGHRDGLTSADEFAIGKELHDTGEVKEGRIHLTWESPLGYVEYPDGYQFMICAYEPDMIVDQATDLKNVKRALEEAIKAKPAAFEAEYQHERGRNPELPFGLFAIRQATKLINEAEDLYNTTLDTHNLKRTDAKRGMGFRINTDETIGLDVIGFDFEYLERKPVDQLAPDTYRTAA